MNENVQRQLELRRDLALFDYGDKMKLKALISISTLLIILAAKAGANFTFARETDNYSTKKAQQALRDKMLREVGGRDPSVVFDGYALEYFISNSQTGVRGIGVYIRNGERKKRNFSYEATVNIRNGYVERSKYNWKGGWTSVGGGDKPIGRP